MQYDFDKVTDRRGTNSLKWEFMTQVDAGAGRDTIPLWVADMDFPCAEPIIKALHRRVDRLIFGYSSWKTPEYCAAVTGWYRRRFGWDVDADSLVFSPGIVPAVNYLVELLTEPGDPVIIQRPVYTPFTDAVEVRGRKVVNNALKKDGTGRYSMDYDDLEKKASESGAKLLIFSSPHNPVGRVWTEDELRRFAEICRAHNITIISDEIHYDLLRRGIKQHPLETVMPDYRNKIITCTAPSKTFNIAGLQASNIVIRDPGLRSLWSGYVNRQLHVEFHNALAIEAVQAAYNEGEPWLEELLDYLDGQVDYIARFLEARIPKAGFCRPEGTYLAWIDLSAYCEHGADGTVRAGATEGLVSRLTREAGVMVESGTIFGPEGAGFVRLNFACPRSTLAEGLNRMAKGLEI